VTFKEIQDAVLLDRFNETQRAAIKFAINSRYGRVWAQEPWAFKRVWVDHSLSAGEDSFTLADVGLQTVEAVFTDLPPAIGACTRIVPNWPATLRASMRE
jgi:hypothetical protein